MIGFGISNPAVFIAVCSVIFGLVHGVSQPCGDHICDVGSYCDEIDSQCRSCERKCNENNPNYNKEHCAEKCPGYVYKASANESSIIQWTSLAILVVASFALGGGIYVFLQKKGILPFRKTDSSNAQKSGNEGIQGNVAEDLRNQQVAKPERVPVESEAPPSFAFDNPTLCSVYTISGNLQLQELDLHFAENEKNHIKDFIVKQKREPSESGFPGNYVYESNSHIPGAGI